jgi:hypothetical protein
MDTKDSSVYIIEPRKGWVPVPERTFPVQGTSLFSCMEGYKAPLQADYTRSRLGNYPTLIYDGSIYLILRSDGKNNYGII